MRWRRRNKLIIKFGSAKKKKRARLWGEWRPRGTAGSPEPRPRLRSVAKAMTSCGAPVERPAPETMARAGSGQRQRFLPSTGRETCGTSTAPLSSEKLQSWNTFKKTDSDEGSSLFSCWSVARTFCFVVQNNLFLRVLLPLSREKASQCLVGESKKAGDVKALLPRHLTHENGREI